MREVREAFARFWPLTRGDRTWLLLIIGCVVVAALAETASILLFAQLTDHALKAGSLSAFWEPAGAWLGVAVIGAIVGYLGNSLAVWTAERFVLRLRASVFRHVQDLAPDFFQKHRQGDLVERLTGDVEAIEQMVVSGVVGTVSAAFSAVFYATAALWLRWDLALVTFLLAPLFLVAARRFAGRIKTASQEERAADGAITSVVEESLGNVVLTQAYNRRRAEEKRLDREARAWMRASVRGARASEMYEQFVEVVETLCVLAVIGLGAWEISKGRMSLGQLLAFAAFLGYLYPPIRNLGQLGLTLTAATAGAERIQEILDTEPAVTEPAEPVREWPVHGWVSFHGASFRYPGTDRESLHDVTFTAGPGELVIVTGPSGAGKSTLSKLLTRFYDPTAGVVCLDGVPLPDVSLEFLRENVALLPQETLILHGTIRENIECGRPGASRADIERAATDAVAHDFISALPDGYDTEIAPGTATLSGGQLQRIAIARAMLRAAPVLVLDEPTAGLDSIAARRVVQPLRRLMAGRTTIMITHDLSLAPDADRILVVDGGRLVEAGTHDELMAWGGAYARLATPELGYLAARSV
ncbi:MULTISPECIES: ABC transporter ATP-binding protein [Streptomyces]|uniref:ABC transporter ATP-binding protein n=1 Tax=Streptomyces mirabilis TaxID=68239 RepID=A0ABU3UQW7_9ACTN|nr:MULTISPECIES: ABC transporter ATP-binding protein [Streptomyces]MDU8996328.1 ABC transporter ATP-binding protein [Streptomyces mirabilis]NMI59310.1 ABC transporter ATP-binding protein [Streptomyces sp. RLA2-12]QDN58569.1 ABC transporter ATP-binding protein [Streptomyces sp. S1D4-20]QDN68663.1 ABC transporter ATP-binding protein [Streptomyces sp. S1D4-14]QDO51081.1 ABC transporter ATP-binding protein [Streptomyces sp. RLB3-5]